MMDSNERDILELNRGLARLHLGVLEELSNISRQLIATTSALVNKGIISIDEFDDALKETEEHSQVYKNYMSTINELKTHVAGMDAILAALDAFADGDATDEQKALLDDMFEGK